MQRGPHSLKLVAGITKPTSGTVKVDGRISALIELGAGFHPEISGRENVFINGIMLGLAKREIQRRFDEIVEFAELTEFIDAPVKTYSSGMYMRLGFAVAIHVDPDVLLVDEVLAVGDAAFRRRALEALRRLIAEGKTVLFISHDMWNVRRLPGFDANSSVFTLYVIWQTGAASLFGLLLSPQQTPVAVPKGVRPAYVPLQTKSARTKLSVAGTTFLLLVFGTLAWFVARHVYAGRAERRMQAAEQAAQ